jgi:transcriptional regulator with XRE-family HTH domain
MSDFAKRLKKVREEKGVSMPLLAHLTGLSKQGVYNLMADDADPRLSTIVLVAKALGIEPAQLMGDGQSTKVDQQTTPVPRKKSRSGRHLIQPDEFRDTVALVRDLHTRLTKTTGYQNLATKLDDNERWQACNELETISRELRRMAALMRQPGKQGSQS